jgi:hypothetical protein
MRPKIDSARPKFVTGNAEAAARAGKAIRNYLRNYLNRLNSPEILPRARSWHGPCFYSAARRGDAMGAAQVLPVAGSAGEAGDPAPRETTLLELVRALGEVTSDDREIVATVLWMLRSGRVKLCGNFRDCPIEDFA